MNRIQATANPDAEAMDDSFRVRVEKIFGSLISSSSQQPSSLRSNLWSLTDDEVKKREWRRGASAASNRDEIPSTSSFDELKKNRRKNFRRVRGDDVSELGEGDNDDDEEEESDTLRRRQGVRADDVNEWDIRSSIGLDSTLDNEEEEDEYDKVASGRDNAGRIYMSSINDQEAYLNFHNVVPKSLSGCKVRCGNYMAAKTRLREDDDEARNQSFLHDEKTEGEKPEAKVSHKSASELRSILKRKVNSSDSGSSKRVRFDPDCNVVSKEESHDKPKVMPTSSSSDNDIMARWNTSGVPDYLRNPSKYTCYSFDSSAEAEETPDTQGCMDVLGLVKIIKSSGSQSESKGASSHLPKSVTFIPKKKGSEPEAVSSKVKEDENGQSLKSTGLAVDIAAGESQESEFDPMDEDEPGSNTLIRNASSERSSRKYRIRPDSEESTP